MSVAPEIKLGKLHKLRDGINLLLGCGASDVFVDCYETINVRASVPEGVVEQLHNLDWEVYGEFWWFNHDDRE
jgi:hypothetical protein